MQIFVKRSRRSRFFLRAALFCPALLLVVSWPLLSPLFLWSLIFVASFCCLFALSLPSTPLPSQAALKHTNVLAAPPPSRARDALPAIPKTAAEVHQNMSFEEFEYFAAAVVLALGQGHRFHQHCGGSGDQGVDAKLLNHYGQIVAVQTKLYASDNTVGSSELRDFGYAISLHHAAYGFFVTTSKFSSDAKWVIEKAGGLIRPIDGRQLDVLLQHRSREIALAYQDILSRLCV